MAKLFGRLNNLSYRGGETGTANVVIDGGVIKVDVVGSPQDVTGAYIIDNKVYITRANASPLEIALPLPQPDLSETNTESLAFVKNKKISYLENDKDYITTRGADKAYIKKVTVNNVEVPILDNDIEQVAQLLVGEGLSVGVNATVSVDTSKIATNEYVDSNIEVVTENITQHKNDYNNPHNVTKAQVGLDKADNTADIDKPISTATKTALDTLQSEIEAHIEDGNNPHRVTAEQVGLGNVDNTSDMDKPVSTLQQQALDTKVDKVEGKGLSTEDFTTELKDKLDGIEPGAQVNTITGVKGDAELEYRVGNVNITKGNIGLENVDNTSDENKPISTAQQEALDGKVDKSSVSIAADANTIAKRHADGKLYVGTPTENYDAANKKYVDDQVSTKTSVTVGGSNVATFNADTKLDKQTVTSSLPQIYGVDGNKQKLYSLSSTVATNTIAYRTTNGVVKVGTPVADNDATTKKYVDDLAATKQDTITSNNTLLDTGLYGSNNSQIYNRDGLINILSDNGVEIDSLSENGDIRIQGAYNSETEKATTIKVHNSAYGLSINTSNIELGAASTDGTIIPYLTIGPGNQVFVDNPKVDKQVANKFYVDTEVGKKQNTLSTTAPIQITEDNNIKLNYDTETLSVAENKLSVKAEGLVGWGLSASSNKLNVNKDTIGSDLAGDGLQYNSTTKKLEVNFYTVGSRLTGQGLSFDSTNNVILSDTYTTTSSTITISDNTLTTIRATSSTIHFNNLNWVELTITRNGDNYSCWGMAQDTATTCNQYIYTVVGNTTDGAVTLDSTAFITETIIR